jgi:hypothetical protein
MGGERTLKEVLREKRWIFLAILLLPVVGMVVAVPLIMVRVPQNFALSLALIAFAIGQYIIVVFFIMRRIDSLTAS